MIYTLLCRPDGVFLKYLGEYILIREKDVPAFAFDSTVVDNKGIDTLKVKYSKPVTIDYATTPKTVRV